MKKLLLIIVLFFGYDLNAQNNSKDSLKGLFTDIEQAKKFPLDVEILDLSNQNITFESIDFSNFKNLKFLSLKNNHLTELPNSIFQLDSLKILDISGNDFKLIPKQITGLKNLEELFLDSESKLDFTNSLNQLIKLPSLKSLHLENDNLSEFPNEILKLQNLERLYLKNNAIQTLPKLQQLEHLKLLDVRNNQLQEDMIRELKNINFGFQILF